MIAGTPGYGDGTRVVHAGLSAPERGMPLLPGPTVAAPYHLAGPGAGSDGYGRIGNPTWRRYEAALAELEGGGEAIVLASGMAAVSAVLLTALGPGDLVVLPSDGYYTTRTFAREQLVRLGMRVREVPTARPLSEVDVAGAALVLLESPSNPGLGGHRAAGPPARRRRGGGQHDGDAAGPAPAGTRRGLLAGQRHQGTVRAQ